jgi:hypothetical protein
VNDGQNTASSAALLARDLKQQFGLAQTEIRGEHLKQNYLRLRSVFAPSREGLVSDALRGLPATAEAGPEPLWCVIIETRHHPALEAVVLNMAVCCDAPIQIFHSRDNIGFIMSGAIAGLVDQGRVILTALNLPRDIAQSSYNQLLLSPCFWEQMIGRQKILVFQTDSMCCPASRFSATDFMSFDYIGSPWGRSRPVGLIIDGGCGGFSLRDWPQSVSCLERFPASAWPAGEDGYFGFHLELMGASVASMEEAGKFSTQDSFEDSSFGCHQIGRLNDLDLAAFIAYCPQARKVFPQASDRVPMNEGG